LTAHSYISSTIALVARPTLNTLGDTAETALDPRHRRSPAPAAQLRARGSVIRGPFSYRAVPHRHFRGDERVMAVDHA